MLGPVTPIERRILRGTRLDSLFERWEASYPPDQRAAFHRDGAMEESTYFAEPRRVVFVQAEPNSRDGAYDRFYGQDLRLVFPQVPNKPNTVQMAMLVGMALDLAAPDRRPDRATVEATLRRFASINLKKLAGSGAADKHAIAEHAWRDRALLREQVRLLEPHVILAGGGIVQSLIGKVLLDDPTWPGMRDRTWRWEHALILPTFHPSFRPYQFERAVDGLARHLGIARNTAG